MSFTGYSATPPPAASLGCPVVVLHELFGLTPHVINVCGTLAAAGHRVAAPNLYAHLGHNKPLPENTDGREQGFELLSKITLFDVINIVHDTADFLQTSDVAILGLSVGGYLGIRLALTDAPSRPRLSRVIALHPGWLDAPGNPLADHVSVFDHLAQLTTPTVVICGDEDALMANTSASLLNGQAEQASIGQLRTFLQHGCGHGFIAAHRPTYSPVAAEATWHLILTELT